MLQAKHQPWHHASSQDTRVQLRMAIHVLGERADLDGLVRRCLTWQRVLHTCAAQTSSWRRLRARCSSCTSPRPTCTGRALPSRPQQPVLVYEGHPDQHAQGAIWPGPYSMPVHIRDSDILPEDGMVQPALGVRGNERASRSLAEICVIVLHKVLFEYLCMGARVQFTLRTSLCLPTSRACLSRCGMSMRHVYLRCM